MLTKMVAVFVLILGLVFGGTVIASAEQDYSGEKKQQRYPYWKDQCYGIVTYKTNSKHRFVREQFNYINSQLNNWTFVKVSKNRKANIKVRFKTPERIANQFGSDGSEQIVGIAYYNYRGSGENKSFVNARVIVPNRGYGWKKTTIHEIWHAVGVSHVPEKYRPSIMNPIFYDSTDLDAYPNKEDWRLLRTVDNKC